MGGREKEITYIIPQGGEKSMLTTKNLSALLIWVRNNVDEPPEKSTPWGILCASGYGTGGPGCCT